MTERQEHAVIYIAYNKNLCSKPFLNFNFINFNACYAIFVSVILIKDVILPKQNLTSKE